MSLDPKVFRSAMGQFATGITVVSAYDGSEVHGMTANSFTSVSLDPPLVLVCVDKRNRTHTLLPEVGRFAVNILSENQEEISRYFAGDRARPIPYTLTEQDRAKSPVFEGVLAWVDCTLWQTYEGGDHSIFVGEVQDLEVKGGRPLLFYSGAYNRLSES